MLEGWMLFLEAIDAMLWRMETFCCWEPIWLWQAIWEILSILSQYRSTSLFLSLTNQDSLSQQYFSTFTLLSLQFSYIAFKSLTNSCNYMFSFLVFYSQLPTSLCFHWDQLAISFNLLYHERYFQFYDLSELNSQMMTDSYLQWEMVCYSSDLRLFSSSILDSIKEESSLQDCRGSSLIEGWAAGFFGGMISFSIIITKCDINYNNQMQQYKSIIMIKLKLFILMVVAANCQPQCTPVPLPPTLPLSAQELCILNLEQYFIGNNLTFKMTPNTTSSYLLEHYTCSIILRQIVGQIISTKYHPQEGYISMLTKRLNGFWIYFVEVAVGRIVKDIGVPEGAADNCSDYAVSFLEGKTVWVVVDCNYTAQSYMRVLYERSDSLEAVSEGEWKMRKAPIFIKNDYPTTTKLSLLPTTPPYLIRSIFSPYNSYLQLYSTSPLQLQTLLDRTSLSLTSFYLKSIDVYNNYLLLLDFNQGLYTVKITQMFKFQFRDHLRYQFYQFVKYDGANALVYLGRRGKVMSVGLGLDGGREKVQGETYHLYRYEPILDLIIGEGGIVVLGETLMSLIRLNRMRNLNSQYKGHSQTYPSSSTRHVFSHLSQPNSYSIFTLSQTDQQATLHSCTINQPYFYLAQQKSSQQITIQATSQIQNRTARCSQKFTTIVFDGQDKIYDSGFNVDREAIYGNIPGEVRINLEKYGIGRSIGYVIANATDSKLDYAVKVQKLFRFKTQVEQKKLSFGTQLRDFGGFQNYFVVQNTGHDVYYLVCVVGSTTMDCKFQPEEGRFGTITAVAYEKVVEGQYYEVIVHHDTDSYKVDVRVVYQEGQSWQFAQICQFQFDNYTKSYLNVSQAMILNNKLYLLFAMVKEIRIYSIFSNNTCSASPFIINSQNHPQLGYFSPQEMHHSHSYLFENSWELNHRQILWLHQYDELLVLELVKNNQGFDVVLVKRNLLPNPTDNRVLVSYPYLIYFSSATSTILQYFITDIYTLTFMRTVPTYNYTFTPSPSVSIQRSLLDANSFMVKMTNAKKQRTIVMYRIEQVVAATMEFMEVDDDNSSFSSVGYWNQGLYLVQWRLIQSSPSSFLVAVGYQLTTHPYAILQLKQVSTPKEEFLQNLTLALTTPASRQFHPLELTLSNSDNRITKGKHPTTKASQIKAQPTFEINNMEWFSGSIFGFQYFCEDCQGRVLLKNKINRLESVDVLEGTLVGLGQEEGNKVLGVVVNGSVVQLVREKRIQPPLANGQDYNEQKQQYSYRNIIPITSSSQNCIQTHYSSKPPHLLSLCKSLTTQYYSLTLTSLQSFKPFILDTFSTLEFKQDDSPKMVVKDNLIIIYTASVVKIFTVSLSGELRLVQMEELDQWDDKGSGACAVEVVGDGVKGDEEQVYGLLVTECDSGWYYLTFTIIVEKEEYQDQQGVLHIIMVPTFHSLNLQQVSLLSILSSHHIQIPSEASSIETLLSTKSQTDQSITVEAFVIYDKFHTYSYELAFNAKTLQLTKAELDGIYYKFGEYINVRGEYGDYLVLKQVLLDESGEAADQMYACYKSQSYVVNPTSLIKERHMFEVSHINAFFKGQRREPVEEKGSNKVLGLTSWILDGHQIYQLNRNKLQTLNVSSNIEVTIANFNESLPSFETLFSQKLTISVYNGKHASSSRILLKATDKDALTTGAIVGIVIGSIVLVIFITFVCYLTYQKFQKNRKMMPLIQGQYAEEADLDSDQAERSKRSSLEGNINLTVRDTIEEQR